MQPGKACRKAAHFSNGYFCWVHHVLYLASMAQWDRTHERTIRDPILARVPFAFSWPLYYHLCRDLFALSNRTGTFPSQQTNKKRIKPKPNTIEKGKSMVLLLYTHWTYKNKKTFPNQKKHTNFLCGMARVAVPSARAGGGKGPGRRRCPPGARRACRIPCNRTAVNWIHIHKKSRS